MLSASKLEEEFDLSESQLAKMEQIVKERSNRLERRKSLVDKRGSIKLKNLNRESLLFTKAELGTVQSLATYFENVEGHMEEIEDYCLKKRIHFLIELKSKIGMEDYKTFLGNLELYRLPEGARIQEEGKFHSYHYIILDGHLAAFHEKKIKDQEKECLEMFQYQVGEAIISNLLQTHKANPYTIKAKRQSLLLRFTDEVYLKFLKKMYVKQLDQLATLLNRTLVFKGIAVSEIKKYLPYCSIRRYRYNDLVYDEGDLIKQLFLILEGEIEISYDRQDNRNKTSNSSLVPPIVPHNYYKANHQSIQKKEIKVVRVGKRELFGLEAFEIFNQNYYQHHARVTSDVLKTLAIGLDVLYDIEIESPVLEENLHSYLKKINLIHNRLLQKSEKINVSIPQQQPNKKKKKRKLRRKLQKSLEWWGLAAKIQDSKKYRLPTPPPKSQSAKHLIRKEPLQMVQRTSKLDYFKRRLFQDQMQALQAANEKENITEVFPNSLVPRLQKMKIKMINSQPKVINNAERVKKKLIEYARNGEVFCDKLQLE